MKQTLTYTSILVTLVFSSCYSSMKVRVDALNMPAFRATFLYNSENIAKREKFLHNLLSDEFQQELNNSITRVTLFIDTSGVVPIEDARNFVNEIDSTSKLTINGLNANAGQLLISSMALRTDTSVNARLSYERDLNNFEKSLGRLNALRKRYNEILNNASPLDALKAILPFSTILERVNSTYGETIIDDPFASIIAALPEQYWNKYKNKVNLATNNGSINQVSLGDIKNYTSDEPNRVNNTYARTHFGNSDIAIKMASPGEFIVKGVRTDADEAVRNSFKVVSQGIKYLAFSSGIPVSHQPNAPKKSIEPLLDSAAKQTNDLQSAKDRYSKATDAFLAILTAVSDDLNATKGNGGLSAVEIRQVALERVKTAYRIYSRVLSNQ